MTEFQGCLIILAGLVVGALIGLIVVFTKKLNRLFP
jgi:hypothetical protein